MPRRYSSPRYLFEIPWQVFDLAIFVLLAASASLHVWGHLHGNPFPLTPLSGLAFLTLVYGSFVEPRLLAVRRFALGKGERVLRVAFLSDLHVGPYKGTKWMRRLVRKTNALAPVLVLIGGDLLY